MSTSIPLPFLGPLGLFPADTPAAEAIAARRQGQLERIVANLEAAVALKELRPLNAGATSRFLMASFAGVLTMEAHGGDGPSGDPGGGLCAMIPALDPHLPAGVSPTVIQHELRKRLGFRGLTITDSIDAGAVRPLGTLANRSVQAAAAGDDLILAATTNPEQNTPVAGLSVMHAGLSACRTPSEMAAALQAARRIQSLRTQP
ncbi:MAG TPA: glycoside hydrolase family 3 N-terminal domain-containing protein [Solirubrobacteraceae bacterium]|nr:glycoside hydrolase family 3 N-terminal domain-containing protein [Solirubrobacteraceae bacterium]